MAYAQGDVTIDVGDCVKLKSPGERLDCYERQVSAAEAKKAAAAAAPAPAAAPPAPRPAVPPPTAAAAAAVAPAAVATANAETHPTSPAGTSGQPGEVVATIKELRETVPNAWLITLDNGQVWRQSVPETYLLQAGMRVTLRPSKWGAAYRLSADELRGYIQVQRVK